MLEIECKRDDCWWQSGDENRHNECCRCSHNSKAEKKEKDCFIDVLDKFTELYDYLRGIKLPDGLSSSCKMPRMSAKKAFSIIYILQEVTCCLPDYIEQCRECLDLFDSEREGCHLDDQYEVNGKTLAKKYWGDYCDSCVPDIVLTVS